MRSLGSSSTPSSCMAMQTCRTVGLLGSGLVRCVALMAACAASGLRNMTKPKCLLCTTRVEMISPNSLYRSRSVFSSQVEGMPATKMFVDTCGVWAVLGVTPVLPTSSFTSAETSTVSEGLYPVDGAAAASLPGDSSPSIRQKLEGSFPTWEDGGEGEWGERRGTLMVKGIVSRVTGRKTGWLLPIKARD